MFKRKQILIFFMVGAGDLNPQNKGQLAGL
jgi:hypothetical protein